MSLYILRSSLDLHKKILVAVGVPYFFLEPVAIESLQFFHLVIETK